MAERICIITRPDLQPTVHGAAVKIMRTAESLSRLGAEVFIVTNDRLWFYRLENGVALRRRYPQTLLSLTNVPPALKDRLAALGIPTYWDGVAQLLRRLGYPRDEHFLYQALVDPDFWLRVLYVGFAHQIDVYQAEFPGYALPAILASRLLGGQSALVEHNVEHIRLADTTELSSAILTRIRGIERWCARTVDHAVAVSAVDRELLLSDGVPREKLAIIPHGVDLSAYQGVSGAGIRSRYRIPPGVPLLVFHGTLHYWPNTVAVKHIAEDLLPRLKARGVNVHAMICGMNPPRYYTHPDITFTEVVQDLPQHLAAANLAVVPLDDGGGTRLKILEYFAAGLPVVSTSKGAEGIPTQSGVHLEIADDLDLFADIVATLLRDPARARRLGEAGRQFVQAYDWDAVCGAYLTKYRAGAPHFPIDVPVLSQILHRLGGGSGSRQRRSEGDARPVRQAATGREDTLTTWDPGDRRPMAVPADEGVGADSRGADSRGANGPGADSRGADSRGANGPGADTAAVGTSSMARNAAGPAEPLPPAMAAVVDHIPAAVHPTKPLTMIMMINRGCNLRCDFCDLYERPKLFPREDALRILGDAAAMGVRTVVFTGGEPFMHPGLWDMIKLARSLGMGTNVTTNGTLVKKHLEHLIDSGLDSVSISLDGLKESHEALRKVQGCYDATLEGLDLLRRQGIHTNIYFVMTGQNIHELIPVYELARDRGHGFDFWPVNDAHHLYIVTPEHRTLYREAIDALAHRDPAVAAKRDYYYSGLDYHGGWDRHVRCLGLIEQFGVNLEGDLVPCCVWDNTDLKVGSAKTTPLGELWHGPQAKARREQIFHEGCHNRCFNHSLYEFQLSTGLSFVVSEGSGSDATGAVTSSGETSGAVTSSGDASGSMASSGDGAGDAGVERRQSAGGQV